MILTMLISLLGITTMFGMSMSKMRNHARFLSDRMAYELDLTPYQYDDVYEINFDYIYRVNRIMDDVVFGYRDAIDHYYRILDDRNDDLRYVLNYRQYQKFMYSEYLFRPIYSDGYRWNFRIYTVYHNHTFFYFDAPHGYKTYHGGHSRHDMHHDHYYSDRYGNQHNDRYLEPVRIENHRNRGDQQKSDFGVNTKERNNKEQNERNNYSNRNQSNRTSDHRYEDNSGNQHSPSINNRNENNGGTRNQSTGNNSGNRNQSTGSTSGTRTQSSGSSNSGTRTQSSGSNTSNRGGGSTSTGNSSSNGSSSSTRSGRR